MEDHGDPVPGRVSRAPSEAVTEKPPDSPSGQELVGQKRRRRSLSSTSAAAGEPERLYLCVPGGTCVSAHSKNRSLLRHPRDRWRFRASKPNAPLQEVPSRTESRTPRLNLPLARTVQPCGDR